MFIDFLNLKNKKLTKNKLVVFYWKSGSWKSTYLDFFMKKKKYENNIFLFHKTEKIVFKKFKQKYIFIDEIATFYWIYVVIKYLLDWKKLFIATHIHPIIYKILFWLFYKWKYFFTDVNNKKIETILEKRWYIFSKKSIKHFIKKYKWNFTDLEIILNFYKEKKDFSEIIYLFEKECMIKYHNNFN